jgi:hypothetical protein
MVAGRAAAADEVDYFAILSDGAKIGHAVQTRSVQASKVITTYTMVMSIDRLGTPITMTVTQEDIETPDGKPLGFKTVQDLSIMSQEVEGTVTPDGKLTVTTGPAGQTPPQTMDWPAGALLSEGVLLLQKQKGLKEGTAYSCVEFDPTGLRGRETAVRVVGKKPVDVLGRQETLWEVQAQTGGIATTNYLNDDFKSRKSTATVIGMNMEIVACTKEFALSQNAPVDVTSKAFVSSPQALPNLADAATAIYHLSPKEQVKLTVPSYDNQTVSADPNGLTVTVTAPQAPAGVAFPYEGNDPAVLAAMKPSMYLESDKPEVVALARQAIGTTKDAAEAARRIESFVRSYITSKDFSVAYAKAGEVVKTRRGDCTEHAVLAAALCRAVGIPAQVVTGMAYLEELGGQQEVFGGHAWAMAYLGGKWYPLDPTLPGGYDVGHIALAAGDGNPADYLGITAVVGSFTIDAVSVQPQAPAATSRTSSRD